MPERPKRQCSHPNCGNLVDSGTCSLHGSRSTSAAKQRRYDDRRGSSAARGYDTAWQKFRAWFVIRHPLCGDCLKKPVKEFNAVEEVHHVRKLSEYPELRLVEENCVSLCKACHSVRTARGE